MPIDTQCPHCRKAYRLKDDLAGKRVTCANAECRQVFTVGATAVANGSSGKAAAPPAAARPRPATVAAPSSPPPPPAPDAEAMAAAAFAEETGTAVPEDQRVIKLTCGGCEHTWDVPWAMQGKNVLCPECRTRQRVPEQKQAKAADWRDPNATGPSGRKIEKLEGVVASTTDSRYVSGETLRASGAVEDNIEPRPRWHYFAGAGTILAVVLGIGFGVFTLMQSRKESKQQVYMEEALADFQDLKESPIPTAEQPMYRVILSLAAAEYALRQNDPARLKEALNHFARARQDLDAAPRSLERDVLLSELALAQINLGGNDEQVGQQTRIRWLPQPARDARAKAEGKIHNVQDELRQTFTEMRKPDKTSDREVRFHTVRRLARELAKRGQPEVLSEALLTQAFAEEERAQALAEVSVETLKVTGDQERARIAAENLKAAVQPIPRAAPWAQAIWEFVDPPVKGVIAADPPSAAGPISDGTRQAFTVLALLRNQTSEALELAKRPGSPGDRARTLALVAEWSPDPAPAIEAAAEVVASRTKESPTIPEFTLVRLATQAGRAKMTDKVDLFVKSMQTEDGKSWARAEAFRELAAKEDKVQDESAITIPENTKDLRAGHAWGRLVLARNNARVTNNNPDAKLSYERWGKASFRPFGLAGLALGLQDRENR